MAGKYSFQLQSPERRVPLPYKIVVGGRAAEPESHVLLRVLAYLLFHREHLQFHVRALDDAIAYEPDLIELDYQLRPVFWAECGDCSVEKLDRLAVKVPEAEIWVIRRSAEEAESLIVRMQRHALRRQRYHVLAFEGAMMAEMEALLRSRNEVFWVEGRLEPARLQFDFNGLWFDAAFQTWRV